MLTDRRCKLDLKTSTEKWKKKIEEYLWISIFAIQILFFDVLRLHFISLMISACVNFLSYFSKNKKKRHSTRFDKKKIVFIHSSFFLRILSRKKGERASSRESWEFLLVRWLFVRRFFFASIFDCCCCWMSIWKVSSFFFKKKDVCVRVSGWACTCVKWKSKWQF